MKEETGIKLKRILSEYESELTYSLMQAIKDKDTLKQKKLEERLKELEEVRKELLAGL